MSDWMLLLWDLYFKYVPNRRVLVRFFSKNLFEGKCDLSVEISARFALFWTQCHLKSVRTAYFPYGDCLTNLTTQKWRTVKKISPILNPYRSAFRTVIIRKTPRPLSWCMYSLVVDHKSYSLNASFVLFLQDSCALLNGWLFGSLMYIALMHAFTI